MSFSNQMELETLDLFLNGATASSEIFDTINIIQDTSPGNLHLALHSLVPNDASAQNSNELSYSGYARIAVPRQTSGRKWVDHNGGSPPVATTITGSIVTNLDEYLWAATATPVTIRGWSLGIASSGATRIVLYGALALETSKPFVNINTSTDAILAPAHGLSTADQVVIFAVEGQSLPTGVSNSTFYTITVLDADSFTLDGASITVKGSGRFAKAQEQLITAGSKPMIPAGQVEIRLD